MLPPPTDGPIDVVVHLGSGDPDARARRRENVTEGVDRTLAEAIARDADHLVFVSSAMVYGAWPNNPVPLTEDAILRPDVDFVYARQLAAAEAMADRWRRQRPGRTVAVLRPVVSMAADGSSHLARSLAAGLGERFGEDDPAAQFLHLDDLAAAVHLAVRKRLDGVFNVAPDGWIAGDRVRALSGERPRLKLPDRAAEVARRTALAVPTRADPARSAQLHPSFVGGRQRPAETPGLEGDGDQRAGVRRGHRGSLVDDGHPAASSGDHPRWNDHRRSHRRRRGAAGDQIVEASPARSARELQSSPVRSCRRVRWSAPPSRQSSPRRCSPAVSPVRTPAALRATCSQRDHHCRPAPW